MRISDWSSDVCSSDLLNRPFTLGGTIIGGVAVSGGAQVMDAKAPAYTLVDLDARRSLAPLGMGDKTYLPLNVSNVVDKLYYGGFDGRLDAGFAAASRCVERRGGRTGGRTCRTR